MADKIRVLIVNDSPFMRMAIKAILESDPQIEVIALQRTGKKVSRKPINLSRMWLPWIWKCGYVRL